MTLKELEYTNKTLSGIKNDVLKFSWVAFLVFVAISSMIGDTIILIATIKYKAIKLNKTIVVAIQHIAVCDLMVVLTYVLPKIISIIAGEWVFGNIACDLIPYTNFFVFSTGMFLVSFMTTIKMLHIKYPLRFVRYTSTKMAHCLCSASWIGALVCLTLIIFIYKDSNEIFSYRGYGCIFTNTVEKLSFLRPIVAALCFFGPACVVTATTGYILVKAKGTAERIHRNMKWQGTLATILTALFYIVSAAPQLLYRFLEHVYSSEYKSNTHLFVHFYRVADSFLLFNTISNFYIYCLTITSFRAFVHKTICCGQTFARNSPSSQDNSKLHNNMIHTYLNPKCAPPATH